MKNNLRIFKKLPLTPPSPSPFTVSDRVGGAPVARILVPVDFSAESRSAVEYAGAVGKKFRAAVTWVHVVKPLVCEADYGYGLVIRQFPDQDEVRKARAKLKRLSSKMTHGLTPKKVLILSGTAPFEITEAAKALGTDLIIMASRGEGRAPRELGSTAERVLRQAPCPVFILKKKASGAERSKPHERNKPASLVSV